MWGKGAECDIRIQLIVLKRIFKYIDIDKTMQMKIRISKIIRMNIRKDILIGIISIFEYTQAQPL